MRSLGLCVIAVSRQPIGGHKALGLVDTGLDGREPSAERLLRLPTTLIEPRLHIFETLRAEQPAQQRLPVAAPREQELREPVLREQDHLQELLPAELEDLVELACDIDRACGASPLSGALVAAQRHSWAPELLYACSSGDTAGTRDRVVGYAAFRLRTGRG